MWVFSLEYFGLCRYAKGMAEWEGNGEKVSMKVAWSILWTEAQTWHFSQANGEYFTKPLFFLVHSAASGMIPILLVREAEVLKNREFFITLH